MTTTRSFDALRSEATLATTFLSDLITPTLEQIALDLRDALDKTADTTPLNPGRENRVTWNHPAISENFKTILTLSTALDVQHSALYTKREEQLRFAIKNLARADYNIVAVELQLADNNLIEHIKRESPEVNYHREPHPNESAGIAKRFILSNQNGSRSTLEEQARAASAFAIHDADYSSPNDGINEINSAALLYAAKLTAYSQLHANIKQDKNIDADVKDHALIAIQEYKKSLAYEVWKTVVTGTTMMKKIDGQPTLFTAQKIGVEIILQEKLRTYPTVIDHGNTLDRQTLTMSMIDSNFAAFVEHVENDPVMHTYLPATFLPTIPQEVQRVLFGERNHNEAAYKTTVNTAGLLYGQNQRMFPEIHAAFKTALFQASFDITQDGNTITITGVTLWNYATEAARAGNKVGLQNLLAAPMKNTVEIKAFPPGSAPSTFIQAGATIQDIFINRINSEILFARGQGIELYKVVAKQLGIHEPPIQYDSWQHHAVRLERLRDHYQNASKDFRLALSMALFHIASHQPGVFLEAEKRLHHIQQAEGDLKALPDKQADLAETLRSTLQTIRAVEIQLKQASITQTPPTTPMNPMRTTTGRIAQDFLAKTPDVSTHHVQQLQTQLQQHYHANDQLTQQLGQLTIAIEQAPHQLQNLQRARAELNQIRQQQQQKSAFMPLISPKSNL